MSIAVWMISRPEDVFLRFLLMTMNSSFLVIDRLFGNESQSICEFSVFECTKKKGIAKVEIGRKRALICSAKVSKMSCPILVV